MVAHTPVGGMALDLGFGGAHTNFRLARAGLKATGADLFLRAMRSVPADKRTASLSLVHCEAGRLHFPDETPGLFSTRCTIQEYILGKHGLGRAQLGKPRGGRTDRTGCEPPATKDTHAREQL